MSTVSGVQSQPSKPIIVKIIQPEQKSDLQGLSDVLLGSLGLTGLITLAALLLVTIAAVPNLQRRTREM